MPKFLKVTVHVDGTRYDPGRPVPDEVAEKITNPDVWAEGDSSDQPESESPGGQHTPIPNPGPDSGAGSGPGAVDPNRPKGNASREDWAKYAAGLEPPVAVTGGMSRDEIAAAVDAQQAAQRAGQASG